ncbi:Trichothecene 3-O-acetyltransferase [Daldinia childiae]|uniref:Trichothecene 3-O-acetyltransferase n=1 Tax=Daldinia childiae TaxID=326645 RepID=UPI001446E6A0|nr:Trichothecene 3-O-acetyltransferase [Daldinia childiae]KAF3055675.1 Trichothecene 3-O-acetyltransferase [Daldinia childiae]
MSDFSHLRDIVGQLPFLKTYSHLLLAFPLRDESRDQVINRLQLSAYKLTEAFPWLAAKVVNRGSGPGDSGVFELEPCSLWSAPNSILRIKDCSELCPPFEKLVQARGPATMLNGDILGPRAAFPDSYQETEEDPAPVIAFQANLIKGGLLLDCAAQHNFIDMSGIEQCYNLLATGMGDVPFSYEAVKQGNIDRRNLLPLLRPGELMNDHSHFNKPPPSDPSPSLAEPDSPFSWRYFRFSAAKLAELKLLATSSEESNRSIPYISTNDALTAFCWQRVISIRLRRRQTPHANAKILRAVDTRKIMGVPQGYMGDLITISTSVSTFQELANASLPEVASILRNDLNYVNTQDYVRSYATFVARTLDKSNIVYGGRWNPDTDIGSSSWAQVQLSRVNFGSLGKPALVRRPTFKPLRSNIYFMPRTISGDIDALLCFNEEDMNGLMADPEWNSFTDYIG